MAYFDALFALLSEGLVLQESPPGVPEDVLPPGQLTKWSLHRGPRSGSCPVTWGDAAAECESVSCEINAILRGLLQWKPSLGAPGSPFQASPGHSFNISKSVLLLMTIQVSTVVRLLNDLFFYQLQSALSKGWTENVLIKIIVKNKSKINNKSNKAPCKQSNASWESQGDYISSHWRHSSSGYIYIFFFIDEQHVSCRLTVRISLTSSLKSFLISYIDCIYLKSYFPSVRNCQWIMNLKTYNRDNSKMFSLTRNKYLILAIMVLLV